MMSLAERALVNTHACQRRGRFGMQRHPQQQRTWMVASTVVDYNVRLAGGWASSGFGRWLGSAPY
jgi:hypothetical protein